MTTTVVHINENKNPGCLTQLLWFLFVGCWASQIWVFIAWMFMALIITIPIGVKMINVLPKVVALRGADSRRDVVVVTSGENSTVITTSKPEVNIFLRIIYFFCVGWWASLFWMELAWLLSLTIIGLPAAFWMFDKTPAILSLKR